ncbi:MAG: hypothetical protein H6662_16410 [Ardenticatenaceae bacterium]|nr:hypothetical protein [Ardenticatenaceae bacterium]MCB9005180.1 hypothetical protein [Ardenticatenaceae bacterium]
MERPDLSGVPEAVQDYIDYLEQTLLQLQAGAAKTSSTPEPDEPPTTINVITISASGMAKRTPRHLYGRQRRGGMGVFDIELPDDDRPALLALADETDHLLLFTDQGRAFRLAVGAVPETAVRGRGIFLPDKLPFRPGERIIAALPADKGHQVALVSKRGWVRLVHKVRLGSSLIPGMSFFDTGKHGAVVAACWTNGQQQLLMATRQGLGIRFLETQVHQQGTLGLRVEPGDEVVAVTAVTDDSAVFLLSDDGKGTLRQMEGFRINKSPGAGGKVAMKTETLVAAVAAANEDDLFVISTLGKMIRFRADEIPAKTGVVQGVNCMTLRNDVVTATAVAHL